MASTRGSLDKVQHSKFHDADDDDDGGHDDENGEHYEEGGQPSEGCHENNDDNSLVVSSSHSFANKEGQNHICNASLTHW